MSKCPSSSCWIALKYNWLALLSLALDLSVVSPKHLGIYLQSELSESQHDQLNWGIYSLRAVPAVPKQYPFAPFPCLHTLIHFLQSRALSTAVFNGSSRIHVSKKYCNKMLGYRRDTALQGALVWSKSGKLELGEYFTDIISLSSTTVT